MLDTMALDLLLLVLAGAGPDFHRVGEWDGVTVEARPVEGSAFVELKLTTTTSTASVTALCDAAFGTGEFDPQEPDLKSRRILRSAPDERVTYDQISPPLVKSRDYAVLARRIRQPDGSCHMTFAAANDEAPPRPEGWIRLEKVKGAWIFEPAPDGKVKITYLIHSDPAGTVPPFLVEGSRRSLALRWVKLIVERATAASRAAPR